MRNLKRALSLALAAAMVIGMMVIGASAASTYEDFTDKDEIQHTEAVNTMVSLGVLAGKDDGSYFDPTGTVTRAEMAKIVAVCLSGGVDPVTGSDSNSVKFSDVPVTHWAYKYISFCVQQNIIAGRGDGTFGPEDPVTGSAAAKMFLCALGYSAEYHGLVGKDWELNTNVLANQNAGLYDGLNGIDASKGLSRDATAQMAYNAVQADEIDYTDGNPINGVPPMKSNGTMLKNRFGVVKVTGVLIANETYAISGNSTLAGKVRLSVRSIDGVDSADLNKVGNTFSISVGNEYMGREIVLYVKFQDFLSPNAANATVLGSAILTDSNNVAENTARLKDSDKVKDFLKANGLALTADATLVRNGVVDSTVKANDYGALSKAIGTLAGNKSVFVDNNNDGAVDYILLNTYTLAKLNSASSDEINISGVGSVDMDDVVTEASLAKGDYVLYTTMDETYYMSIPEPVTATGESYDSGTPSVKFSGTDYTQSAAKNAISGELDSFVANNSYLNGTYDLYLDESGYLIATAVSEESTANYALVLSSGATTSGALKDMTAQVKLLLPDGTKATYDVNLLASANKFKIENTGTPNPDNTQKERWMAIALDATNGISDANSATLTTAPALTTDGAGLTNMIVTYSVNSSGKVTIGDPAQQPKTGTDTDTGTDTFNKSTARYTIGGTTVVANDSTIFFFNDGTDSSAVVGLKGLTAGDIHSTTGANSSNVVYNTTNNVAKAIFVKATYVADPNYVYVSGDAVETRTADGETRYVYPVVTVDGQTNNYATEQPGLTSGLIYSYTVDDGVYSLDSSLVGTRIFNNKVVSYVGGNSMTVKNAYTGATAGGGAFASNVNVWNVNDTAKVVEDSVARDMAICYTTDVDGFVTNVFVKEVNAVFTSVTNKSGTSLTVATDDYGATTTLGNNAATSVAAGYSLKITAGMSNGQYVNYTYVPTENASKTFYGNAQMKDGVASISMPDVESVLTINSVSGTPVSSGDEGSTSGDTTFTTNASPSDITKALESGNVTIKGSEFKPSSAITIPAGRTLTVEGDFAPTAGVDSQGTLDIKGNYTKVFGDIFGTVKVGGNATVTGAANIQGNMTVTGDMDLDTFNTTVAKGATLTVNLVDMTGAQLSVKGSLVVNSTTGLKLDGADNTKGIQVFAGSSVKLGSINYVGGSESLLTVASGSVIRYDNSGPKWDVKGELMFNKASTYENDNFDLSNGKLTIAANTTVTFKNATVSDGTKLVGVNDTSKFAVDTAMTITSGNVIYTAAASSPSGSNTPVASTTYKWADVDTDEADTTMGWLAE